jgi:hypothetical protein
MERVAGPPGEPPVRLMATKSKGRRGRCNACFRRLPPIPGDLSGRNVDAIEKICSRNPKHQT